MNLSHKRQLILFLIAVGLTAIASGIHDSIFNNFLSDKFGLIATERGWIEFPREAPGFLVVIMAGLLSTLTVTRLGVVSTLAFAAGMVGMAVFGGKLGPMVVVMMLASGGMHLLQPVGASVILGLSHAKKRGRRMGLTGGVGTAGSILGAGAVWLFFDKAAAPWRYYSWFMAAAIMCLLASFVYAQMHIPHLASQPRSKLVVRRKYSLYYCLELLAGARKQIFLTFGPWVLIKVYHEPVPGMAALLLIAAGIGIFFKPIAGMAMDYFGERTIMIVDGLSLSLVCVGYGYAGLIMDSPDHARWLACACYVLDNLLFALGDSRTLYMSRMADSPQELTATVSMGVSINHVASMTIPAIAGLVWISFGYERLFMCGSVLALLLAALSTRVPSKRSREQAEKREALRNRE